MYPQLADIHDDLAYLFQMLTGNAAPSLDRALYHGWTVQGYLQGLLVPVQSGAIKALSAVDLGKLKDAGVQAIDALEVLLSLSKAEKDQSEAAETAGLTRMKAAGLDTLGPALLLQLAQSLLPELMSWMGEWLSPEKLQEFIANLLRNKAVPA
jgi:hypothetical protein